MACYVSICIPSYNRPMELKRLLESVDYSGDKELEIVICEDKAPLGEEVERIVYNYQENSKYKVRFSHNEVNCGYDKNLRQCIDHAHGKWIIFMGDDDLFIPGKLNLFIDFLAEHEMAGYVLRSYQANHIDGSTEVFKYYSEDKMFEAGVETYIDLFNKSTFISGFTFQRELALPFRTDKLDGSLLYQLYILAEICLRYPSAYCAIPFTQSIEGGTPYFGSSESEKGKYTPGTISLDNSVEFIKQHYLVIDYIDQINDIHAADIIRHNMSKYSYPLLSIQRERGIKEFNRYNKMLRSIGLDKSIYYNIYYIGLLVFGKNVCDRIIRTLKQMIGHRPRL